jgi:hypothetical protein
MIGWGPSSSPAMEDEILDDARQIADLTYHLRMALVQVSGRPHLRMGPPRQQPQ